MRYVLAAALLAAGTCAGCKKPAAPQTTAPGAPTKTAGTLKPLTPPVDEPPPAAPFRPTPLVRAESADKSLESVPSAEMAPAPKAAPSETAGVYVLQKGDTFIKLARQFYGNAGRFRDIQAANPGLDPNKLKIGQKIMLPPK